MRILLATKNCTLAYVKSVAANLDSDHIDSFIPDIELLFELCEELETRLLDYKKATNSFLFADIANMALSLLTEPQFEVVAEKIRSRFQFIMVDEYQDTNDFQELFIDSLSAPRKDGTRAHLFFVGDAKQAIYAFRNSNVALFRARQAQYSDGDPAHKAIAMNMNYRSGKKLLSDINHIFSYYMRLDHGSISYRDPMERLDYDEDVNIYGKPFDNFGISRIVSTTGKGDDGVDPMEWECSAIIADIKKKIAEGYLVYDRNCKERIRPCTYGDFCILMRKKAQFEYYQKRFQEEGVPLNCSVSILLREVNSIILLQSLFTLLDAKINGTPCDENHLFASIARSYAYRYEDSYLFGLIHSGSISEDPLMKQIEEFAKKHRDDGLEMLFPAVCEEFHVISQLYRIGGVADAIDKIDSIAALARALASSGEGLREFAKLLHEIDKFDLDIKAEAESKSENAVDLMTIHGSKGLERKIVYMPESINCIAKGIAAKNLLAIDGQYGIMLPDYSFSSFDFAPHPVYGAAYALWKKENSSNADADEHVRLFYVALTRAENSVIFVGDDLGKTEDIYAMISCAPNYYEINADFAKIALSKHIVAEALFRQNKTLDEIRKRQEEIVFPPCVDEDSAKTFNELIIYFFGERLQKRMDDCLGCIEQAIFTHYLPHLESVSDSDLLARIYAYYQFSNPSIGSLQELNAYISALITRKKANGEAEEDSGIDDGLKPVLASDLVAFRQAIVELDLPYFHMKLKSDVKKSEEEAARLAMMAKTFASSLVFAFEGFPKFAQRSFSTSSFEDKVAIFDYTAFSSSSKGSFPAPPSLAVDDEEIRFPLIVKTRASKTLASVDEEAKRYALDQGIELHRCMEIVDLRTKDTSFIPNPMYRKMITRALQMDCFASLEGAEIYKEYGFFDSELGSMGYIDLLIIRDGKYEIIDYKTRKISDPAYDEQLRNYARNVARLFGVKQEDIKLTLVSLAEGKTRQVAP